MTWSSPIDRVITLNAGGSATVYIEGGKVYNFNPSGSAFVPATGGRLDTFVQNSSTTWTWTSAEGERTLFTQAPAGQFVVTSISSVGGHVLTFNYDSTYVLQSISDELGRTATVTWNASHQVSSIAFPAGVTVNYTYTTVLSGAIGLDINILTSVQRSQAGVSRTVTYKYEDTTFPEALTGVVDERGDRVATWAWDDTNARVLSSQTGGSTDLTSVSYNDSALTRTVTNPLGKQLTYTFANFSGQLIPTQIQGAASANTPATTVSASYSTAGLITGLTDENGNQTTYTQNSAGQEASRTEAYGTSSARTINTTWSTSLPLPTQIASPTDTANYTYDGNGNVLTRTVTDETSFTTPYSTHARTRSWTYTWSTAGRLLTATDPLSHTTTYTYNTDGFLQTVTNALSHVTTVTAWSGRGAPTSVTDPNGIVTTFTYDIDGRALTATINPGASQSEYQFVYDNAGDLTQLTLPSGGYLQYSYDAARRVTLVTNDQGETRAFTYDTNDDPLTETVKNASATITKQSSAAYDELGRVIQSIGASPSQVTSFAYDKDSNPTSTTDPLSHTRSMAFDPLNRVITETNPESQTVQHSYDARDNLTSQTDGRSLVTSRVVDGFGQVIQEVSPDRGTRTYTYDGAGNLTKLIDGDSVETDYAYDALNRRTSMTFPGGSAENAAYTYDATAGGNHGVGRLTGVTENSGSTSFTYDAQGRIVTDAKVIWGVGFTVSYAYGPNGKVSQITYPSGRTVTLGRNADSEITTVTTQASGGAAQNVATSVTHAPFGPLTGLTFGNGYALTRSYDQNYWMAGTEVTNGTTTPLNLTFYNYDDGRFAEIDDVGGSGARTTYTAYKPSGRLNWTGGPWGAEDYEYDAAGNRIGDYLTVGSTTTSHNEIMQGSTNRLAGIQNASGTTLRAFTWTDSGLMSGDTTTGGDAYIYYYNYEKRMVSAFKNGTQVSSYAYDFQGNRVARIAGTAGYKYIYDQGGRHLLAEYDAVTGAVRKEYIWLDDTPVAVVDSTSGTAQTFYIVTGHLDEPQQLLNSSGTVTWNAYMNPWGWTGTFSTPTETTDLKLPGQFTQAEANSLSQNHWRDYDPTIGRYIQADPLGLAAGPNLFSYVDNDPLNWKDPNGEFLFPLGVVGAGVGALVGAGTNLATQYIQNGGHLECVNWKNVGWSALTGGVDGLLLTTGLGETPAGPALIGAVTNTGNYLLTNNNYTAGGILTAAGSGALGGYIGGPLSNNLGRMIRVSPTVYDSQLAGQFVKPVALTHAIGGGLVGAYDYTRGLPSSCTCHQ